jgi:hypothetical protein
VFSERFESAVAGWNATRSDNGDAHKTEMDPSSGVGLPLILFYNPGRFDAYGFLVNR